MNIDAVEIATQFAQLDIEPFQTRYNTKLSLANSQQSAYQYVDTVLSSLKSLVDDYLGYDDQVKQVSPTLSSSDYFSVTADSSATETNLDLFVEQLATTHQVIVDTSATESTDVFATTGTISFQVNGNTHDLDIANGDMDGDGKTSYSEFISLANEQLDGFINASLIRTQGAIKVLFSAENGGGENQFTVSAATDSGIDANFSTASASPLKEGKDAIVWLGEYSTGLQVTNSSNQFTDLMDGVNLTLTKAQEVGEAPVSLSIGYDSEKTTEIIQEFVDKYNAAVSQIKSLTESGNEDESRGVLASDSAMRNLPYQLSNLIRADYGGTSLYDLGLSIDRYGTLSFDADEFNDAASSTDIEEVFTGGSGVFAMFQSTLDQYTNSTSGTIQNRIDTLTAQQDRLNESLERLESKYEVYYQRYLSQFNQLNALMATMESTSSLFTTTTS